MTNVPTLAELGVYTSRAPRYTSFPTAAQFHTGVDASFAKRALENLPDDKPVSVYIHIPFCERLCWYCACRTQGTKSHRPVAAYLQGLLQELTLVKSLVPEGIQMGRLHWGGGTPTILKPAEMRQLAGAIKDVFAPAERFEFSVEIDPTLVDSDKIAALSEVGMNRASVGIQDFDPKVQKAIGRLQSLEQTADCVADLRAQGIDSLNTDILYGLPHQTEASVRKTLEQVQSLSPDRIAIYGYAHVPWMAKRQQMIDEAALPDGTARRDLFALVSHEFQSAGYVPVGIDHYAKPGDTLAQAAASGNLRRNFQGYTTDRCDTLIGLGASSISKFAEGFAQNAPRSSLYLRHVTADQLATQRGVVLSESDRLRARAIEMVMCDFALDLDRLQAETGMGTEKVHGDIDAILDRFSGYVEPRGNGFVITRSQRALARLVAQCLDDFSSEEARYSAVS
jgi:oxygen-independent coproporphyrinogen-3 oxidase